jgi:hypothetical protein
MVKLTQKGVAPLGVVYGLFNVGIKIAVWALF